MGTEIGEKGSIFVKPFVKSSDIVNFANERLDAKLIFLTADD